MCGMQTHEQNTLRRVIKNDEMMKVDDCNGFRYYDRASASTQHDIVGVAVFAVVMSTNQFMFCVRLYIFFNVQAQAKFNLRARRAAQFPSIEMERR